MDIIEKLVKNVIDIEYEDLPEKVVDFTKNCILDTIGVLISGFEAPGCNTMVSQVKDWGGKKESTIMVYGGKVPSHNAALVNSIMARALDFDDGLDGVPLHVNASTVPTALAVAEQCEDVISGKDLITAIGLGDDVLVRLAKSSNIDFLKSGWDPTQVCGVFGMTATAGKLLGLNENQLLNAFGIAFNQSAGSMQSNIDGVLTIRLNQGLASKNGVISAILARNGITGVKNILQGKYGYYHLYSHDNYNLETLTGQLGKRFRGTDVICKPYPCCRGTHSAIEATLSLVQEYNIKPEDVDKVTVGVSRSIYNLLGHPFKIGDTPQASAQFSLQYTVANAILRRRVLLEHFTEEFIRDPKILALTKRINPIVTYEFEEEKAATPAYLATDVEITTKKGKRYSKHIDAPKGGIANPLTKEEYIEKFKRCTTYSKKTFLKKNEEEIVELITKLEKIDDVCEIVKLLTP